jgi:hypothetical protein
MTRSRHPLVRLLTQPDREFEILAWRDKWQVELDLAMHRAAPALRDILARNMEAISFLRMVLSPRPTLTETIGNSIREWAQSHALPVLEQGRAELVSILDHIGRPSPTTIAELPRFDAKGPEVLALVAKAAAPAVGAIALQVIITFWGTTTVTSGWWIFTWSETLVAWWVLPLTMLVWAFAFFALFMLVTTPGRVKRNALAKALELAEELALGSSGLRGTLLARLSQMADSVIITSRHE